MRKIWANMKFDELLVLVLTVILAIVLFTFGQNQEIVYLVLGAFLGAFNANTSVKNLEDEDDNK